ncbi:hypothetical protein PSACC_01465 [Paramicrosporidium saccamoebae]|uniref:Uncharacterized protein n=1 Tax=Paramicrosporidium saccamoebae TaxID=1246581 RepID=A0A2H9TLS6_9FUNG|nr:hypothetical protein PSACC_01465 [Paramicrosporidium saccamoebae]
MLVEVVLGHFTGILYNQKTGKDYGNDTTTLEAVVLTGKRQSTVDSAMVQEPQHRTEQIRAAFWAPHAIKIKVPQRLGTGQLCRQDELRIAPGAPTVVDPCYSRRIHYVPLFGPDYVQLYRRVWTSH